MGINDENSKVIILTGRTEIMKNVIEEIFEFVELKFDQIILRPNIDNKTCEYKAKALENILSCLENETDSYSVQIWDDNRENVNEFNLILPDLLVKYKCINHHQVNLVPSDYFKLPKKQEREFASRLLIEMQNLRSLKKPLSIRKVVTYTGIKLEPASKLQLIEFAKEKGVSDDWTFSAHHMTINLGPANKYATLVDKKEKKGGKGKKKSVNKKGKRGHVEEEDDDSNDNQFPSVPYKLGEKIEMKVSGYNWIEDKIFAVSVRGNRRPLDCYHSNPHITVAISENGNAKDSATIKNWNKLSNVESKQLTLTGTVKEFSLLFWN